MNMGEREEKDVKGEILLESPSEVHWHVPGFFSLTEGVYDLFESPSFPYMDGTWCLRCLPNEYSCGGINIFLKREHSSSEHTLNIRLGIKGEDGFEISGSLHSDFKSDDDQWGVPLYVDRTFLLENKTKFALEDKIIFFCMLPAESTTNATSQTMQCEGTDKLLHCLKNILLMGDHHDTIIKVQDQEFRAHKLVLVIRSSYFNAVFAHDEKVRKTGIITIEDCNPEAFKEFLSFLYSGKLENVSAENVVDLYSVADKYLVDEVKCKCVNFMTRNMSDETFCNFISLAITHNERELLKIATDYYVKNVRSIIETVKWQIFHKEYPTESNELFIKASHRIPK